MIRVRRIICSECGVMVENPHRNQKYCPDCRIKVAREQRAISHRREREKKKKQREELHTMDNARVMAVCLNCKRERCTGACKDVLNVGKETAYGADVVLVGYAKGKPNLPVCVADSAEELAERMGVTVSTVTVSWSRFWRGLAKSTRYAMVFIDNDNEGQNVEGE